MYIFKGGRGFLPALRKTWPPCVQAGSGGLKPETLQRGLMSWREVVRGGESGETCHHKAGGLVGRSCLRNIASEA